MNRSSPHRWQQIEELLHSAFDLPPEARGAFLDEACAADLELRREVEELLAADAGAPEFLDAVAADLAAPLLAGMVADDPADGRAAEGTVVGAYRLVREIARGGMGSVYLAERADGEYRQQVAVKILRRGPRTDELVQRFRVERQILAALEHPGIARLVDGGVVEGDLPYLAMEYVDGESVDRFCDHWRLDIRQRLELVVRIARVVQYAHRNKVVHRDLKPSNILVTPEGEPKLLDFGIAKLLGETEALAGEALRTRTGFRWMTPEYAAPEQVRGEAVTAATDVYALGVLLYELLTGHRPYRVGGGGSSFEIERAICEADPERPSTAVSRVEERSTAEGPVTITPETVSRARGTEPERLRRMLNGDLDAVVLRALRKEPQQRYASPEALAEDIERYLAGLPVRARRGTLAYYARRFAARKRGALGAAALTLTLLLALVASLARSPDRAVDTPVPYLAVLPFANRGTEADAYLTDGLVQEVTDELSQLSGLRVLGRAATERYRGTTLPTREIGSILGADAVLEGSARRVGGRIHLSARLMDVATGRILWEHTFGRSFAEMAGFQGELAQHIAWALDARLSESERGSLSQRPTDNAAAYDLYMRGRSLTAGSREENESAAELLRQAIRMDPEFADAHAALAGVYMYRVQWYNFPLEWADSGVALARRAIRLDPRSAHAHNALAANLSKLDRQREAEAALMRVVELSPSDARAMNNLGSLYATQGRYDESIRWLLRAQRLLPNLADPALNLGWAYTALGDFEGARHWLGRAEALGYAVPVVRYYQALLLVDQGRMEEARQLVKATYEQHSTDPFAAGAVGLMAWLDRDWETVEVFFAPLYRMNPGAFGHGVRTKLALALERLGEHERAERMYDEALAALHRALEAGDQGDGVPLIIASIHASRGETEEAYRWLDQAYQRGWRDFGHLRMNAHFDEMRGEPRFQRLLSRMEADVAEMRARVERMAEAG